MLPYHPRLQALNSLLYWLLDLVYKEMGAGLRIPRWAPEPYLLRVPGVEGRMVAELRKLGHLLHVLARAPAAGGGGGCSRGRSCCAPCARWRRRRRCSRP